MPLLALPAPRSVWQPCEAQSRRLVSMLVAARSRLRARSPETEGGRRAPERVGEGGAHGGGISLCVCMCLGGGGASQFLLLAFTSIPHIAKFFSNLQLLDVGANHQRGLPRAYLPYHPSLPLNHPSQHPPPPPPTFSPSGGPSHPGLFIYSCVYLLFHRLRLSRREEESGCENSH